MQNTAWPFGEDFELVLVRAAEGEAALRELRGAAGGAVETKKIRISRRSFDIFLFLLKLWYLFFRFHSVYNCMVLPTWDVSSRRGNMFLDVSRCCARRGGGEHRRARCGGLSK